MLFMEIIAIYFQNYKKLINAFCGQNKRIHVLLKQVVPKTTGI
jgi:hypothetical protein